MAGMKRLSRPLGVVLSLLWVSFLLLPYIVVAAAGEGQTVITRTVDEGRYYSTEAPYIGSDESLRIDFTLLEGESCDVYILWWNAYQDFREERGFYTSLKHERTSGFSDDWHGGGSDTYYIVVDNWDNGRSSDARPSGDIRFELIYTIEFNFWNADLLCFLGMMGLAGVGVAFVFYMDKRNYRKQCEKASLRGYYGYQPHWPSTYWHPPYWEQPYQPQPPRERPGAGQPPEQQTYLPWEQQQRPPEKPPQF